MAEEEFAAQIAREIRAFALAYPETTEGQSCVNRAFKVRKKNFAFLGEKDGDLKLMLKLAASADEVSSLAQAQPDTYQIGSIGWATLRFSAENHPPVESLRRWVDESYRLFAPKKLLKQLPPL